MDAADALEEVRELLESLPEIARVRALRQRWHALRTVVYRVGIEGVPTLTSSQETNLKETAVTLANEIAETWRQLLQ